MQYLILIVVVIAILYYAWPFLLAAVIIALLGWGIHRFWVKQLESEKIENRKFPTQTNHVDSNPSNNAEIKEYTYSKSIQEALAKRQQFDADKAATKSHHVSINSFSTPTLHKLRRKLYDFVIFDIETTGFRRTQDKIIQLSAIKVKHDEVVDHFNYLVNPHTTLPFQIMHKTGLRNEDLETAASIDTIMPLFKRFVEDLPLIGHNIISFDIPFIQSNGFDLTDISAIDTFTLAKKKLVNRGLADFQLSTLKKYYGITNQSHNALNDCETNLLVYQNLRDDNLEQVVIDMGDTPQNFAGLRFAITGEFPNITRDALTDKIKRHGGRVTTGVSGLTDYLIDGTQIADNLTDGIHSGKELAALQRQKDGGKIKILNYDQFTHLVEEPQVQTV